MKRPPPPRYSEYPWLDSFPESRVPDYPSYRGASKRDVVVIGGGLTGCATAFTFASAGLNVILLEADRVGRGRTAGSVGWMSVEPDVDFATLEKTIGVRGARYAFQAWRRAALEGATLLRRLNVKCDFEPRLGVTLATDPDQAGILRREYKERREAGLETALLNAKAATAEGATPALAGLRVRECATLDPYRACVGVAAGAADKGALMFERSAVKRIRFTRKHVDIFTAAGSIRADAVVIATGMPRKDLFKSLIRHFWFKTTYQVLTEPIPAKVRKSIGARHAVVRDRAQPPHLVRWVGDDRLLVSGGEIMAQPPRLRERLLAQNTMELMYEVSTMYPDISGVQPAFGWELDYALTDDGLPYYGPHRNYPRHLFAFGGDSRSVTGSFLASRMLLRKYLDEPEPSDAPFEFARHGR